MQPAALAYHTDASSAPPASDPPRRRSSADRGPHVWPIVSRLLLTAVLAVSLRWGWKSAYSSQSSRPFMAVRGVFLQGNAGAGLVYTASGVAVNLGAVWNWTTIHRSLTPRRKLLLLLRHAEGVHNHAQAVLGRERWYLEYSLECTWEKEGDMFDAQLTPLGLHQARALNSALKHEGFLTLIAPDLKQLRVLTSPLRRTIQTTLEVFRGLGAGPATATELCRETVGLFPCDVRRSLSDNQSITPCPFSAGLRRLFPRDVLLPISGANVSFPVTEEQHARYLRRGAPLGLVSDVDAWWTASRRETNEEKARRSQLMLASIFDQVSEPVVWITSHSGFIRATTRELGLPIYYASNCEIVPLLVEDRRTKD